MSVMVFIKLATVSRVSFLVRTPIKRTLYLQSLRIIGIYITFSPDILITGSPIDREQHIIKACL